MVWHLLLGELQGLCDETEAPCVQAHDRVPYAANQLGLSQVGLRPWPEQGTTLTARHLGVPALQRKDSVCGLEKVEPPLAGPNNCPLEFRDIQVKARANNLLLSPEGCQRKSPFARLLLPGAAGALQQGEAPSLLAAIYQGNCCCSSCCCLFLWATHLNVSRRA